MARNVNSKQLYDDIQFDRIGTVDTPEPTPAPQPELKTKPKSTEKAKTVLSWENQDDYSEKKKVKKTFFFTEQNMDALKLRHELEAEHAREYSRIINDALEAYLQPEIHALEKAEATATSPKSRYYKALSILTSGT